MLRRKLPFIFRLAQKQFRDPDPIPTKRTTEQCFQLASSLVRRRTFVEHWRETFEKTNGDIAVLEGKSFAQEPTSKGDALCIGTPVRETEFCELTRMLAMEASLGERREKQFDLPNTLQPLRGADVPFSPLLDLCEDPRLDQSPSGNHDSVDPALLLLLIVRLSGETVAIAKHRNWRKTGIGRRGA